MNPLRTELGRTIRELREAKALSQERLALAAGVHRSFVFRLEHGTVNVSVDVLQRIAVELGVPVSRLLETAEQRADGGASASQ